ncbi:MAG TPA: Clp protease N-terminal domain-containing protein, partial [Chroococcales cyanobacterium]
MNHLETLSAEACRALMIALHEARKWGDEDVAPDILLVGIVGEGQSPAAKALRDCGIKLDTIRTAIAGVRGTDVPRERTGFIGKVFDALDWWTNN